MNPKYKFAIREDLKDSGINFLPIRANDTDSGWDVRCAEPGGIYIYPFEHAKIRLGFRAFCPEGYWYRLVPRSSTFAKKHLHCLYGTIDQDFSNELLLAVNYIPPFEISRFDEFRSVDHRLDFIDKFYRYLQDPVYIDFGERIAQIIPSERLDMDVEQVSNEEYDNLCVERNSTRKGGFGSSGQ